METHAANTKSAIKQLYEIKPWSYWVWKQRMAKKKHFKFYTMKVHSNEIKKNSPKE